MGRVIAPVSWSNPPQIGAVDTSGLVPHSPPVSMMELPQMVSAVGHELASGESLWTEGPLMIPAVLGADIPVKVGQSCEGSAVDR